MSKLKLAVIGTGHLGRFHAKLAAAGEAFELVGIVEPDEAARSRVSAEVGAPGFAGMAEVRDSIDAAIVAAPTWLHHAICMELVAAGKHVLVEKPITSTIDDANELVAAADAAGVTLQVGHIERFNPALTSVRNRLEAPKYIDAVRHTPYTFRSTDVGVVYDLMIHDLDIVLSIVQSQVVDVEALGFALMGEHEDAAIARLRFANGCCASLSASRISYESQRRMNVWQEDSFVAVDYAARASQVIRPHASLLDGSFDQQQLTAEEKNRLKDKLFEELLPIEIIHGDDANAMADEQADFADSIRQGRRPVCDGHAGREALNLAEWILEKIERHQWDGSPEGRVGRHALVHGHVLHGPHWKQAASRRHAG
ncbi:MAG: Gfo/Idh/MocA family oxidoreductase [Pirellulales bacterium]